MAREGQQMPYSATSPTSNDGQPTLPLRKIRPSAKAQQSSWKGINGALSQSRSSNDSQTLEGRLKDLLQSDEWENIIQNDPARTHIYSQMLNTIHGSLNTLSYIQEPEVDQPSASLPNEESFPRPEVDDANTQSTSRTEEYIASKQGQHGSDTDTEWKLEVKRWKRVDGRTGTDFYDHTQKIEDIRRREREMQGGGYVINVYDVYDAEGNESQTLLEISSGLLVDLLREIITFHPGEEFDVLKGKESMENSVVFAKPYVMLLTHSRRLQEALDKDFSNAAKDHLKVLLDYLRTEHPKWTATLDDIAHGRCTQISYHSVWLLYPPNTPVYVCGSVDDRQVVTYFRKMSWYRGSVGSKKRVKGALTLGSLTLRCWDVKYEHGAFRRTFSDFTVEPYSGVVNVDSLPLVPAAYVQNEESIRNRLVGRGQRYFDLKQSAQMQDYHGDCFPRVFTDEPVRVIVDEDTYRRKNPYKAILADKDAETYGFPSEETSLVDENNRPLRTTLLRCFPELGVFSLRERQWALVKVDDLKPVNFRERAFAKLVMKKEHKNLLKALVKAYMQQSAFFRDVVPGKGRGLAILLHGPPGTGKTLTAECVAEKEQRPLYTISCGDLGTEPEQLEVRLKEVFKHAVAWKAILLLDEADIFLQERNLNDLKRNALVTIFLRELEYFDGIIFMTTNRPGDIDEAFVSRLHVTIELNQPQKEERLKIWKMFIKDLDMPEDDQRDLYSHVMKFDSALNGRQIRNAVRVALALAKADETSVKPRHLEDVLKMGREYDKYNMRMNKMGQEELASVLGRRASKDDKEDEE